MRIAFFSIHPAPYRDPFLNALAQQPQVTLEVFTFFKKDRGHAYWALPEPCYRNTYLRELFRRPHFARFHLTVLKLVLLRRFDLMIFPGFLIHATTTGMLACWLMRRPYAYTSDSVEETKTRFMVPSVKRFLIRRASLVFVPGRASEKFFREHYQIPASAICYGAYALDMKKIECDVERYRAERVAIRAEYGLRDEHVLFLMAANLIKSRCYPVTAEGFLSMAKEHPSARFVIVGVGEDAVHISEMTRNNSSLVYIPGRAFEELKRLYAAADVYVHGGKEPASTALAIGAISGLPLMSSYSVGQAYDCLIDGKTGVVVRDYLSVLGWGAAFSRMMELRHVWPEMGQAAREEIRFLELDECVRQFCAKSRAMIKL